MTFTVSPVRSPLIGPNGAGKSTTMRVILGLDALTPARVDQRRPYRGLRRR